MLREEGGRTSLSPSALSITDLPMGNEAVSTDFSEAVYDQVNCTESPSRSILGSSPTTSTRSLNSFGDYSSNEFSTSLSNDAELIDLACTSLRQSPIEIQALSLSRSMRKRQRPLKNLKALSDLTNLTQLDLSENIVERLDGIQLFTEMQILAIPRNHIKILSPSLFSLKRLTDLDLSGNFIAHLPRAFSDLTILRVLNLSGNNLNTLREVDVLAPLGNLLSCSLAANPFCRLPTYKDYIICKIRSLERLDEVEISQAARDRAAKRFSSVMFSKDLCMREAEQAHEDKQNRLLETQCALEAENLRLKGELQVKSKLLQNKSRAWSSATEQLLQLQQEVALLNLDRNREVLSYEGETCAVEHIATAVTPSQKTRYPSQQRPRSALRFYSPKQSDKKRHGSFTEHDLQFLRDEEVNDYLKPMLTSPDLNETLERNQGKTFVDASCSPLRTIPPAIVTELSDNNYFDSDVADKEEGETRYQEEKKDVSSAEKSEQGELLSTPFLAANTASLQRPRGRANGVDWIEETLWNSNTNARSEVSSPEEFVLEEEEPLPIHDVSHDQVASYPTFEDDVACPAYEDTSSTALHSRSLSASTLSSRINYETIPDAYSFVSQSLPPSPINSPIKKPKQYRKQDLNEQPPLPLPINEFTPSQCKARSREMAAPSLTPFADKEALGWRIQTLQSHKQSLLAEIRNEEHLLHVLKQESAQYADQIDGLTANIQACIDDDPDYIRFSFSPPNSPRSNSKKFREEEIGRARLEILRQKLRFAEDKEKEIEAFMVRVTKRLLRADLNSGEENGCYMSQPISDVPFDKEIFGLTHKLQLVSVEKEDIRMQMNHLMASLRGEADFNVDWEKGGATFKQAQTLAKSRQLINNLCTRHREVTDRIEFKQKRFSALLKELEAIENELKQINTLNETSARIPICQRESDARLFFCQTLHSQDNSENLDIDLRAVSSTFLARTTTRDGVQPSALSSSSDDKEAAFPNENPELGVNPDLLPLISQSKNLLNEEVLEKVTSDMDNDLTQESEPFAGVTVDTCRSFTKLHRAVVSELVSHFQAETDTSQALQDADGQTQPQLICVQQCRAQSEAANVDATIVESDNFDALVPVEVNYVQKYVLAKDSVSAYIQSINNGDVNLALSTHITSAHRILKIFQRLESVEANSKVDLVSKIEVDHHGNSRGSLKILLHAARDLPTAHLRTKNLDPYVCLKVVYPSHVVPVHAGAMVDTGVRSQTKKKSIFPIWNEGFEIAPIVSLEGYLHIRVLNDRRLGHEQLVGEVRIPLHTLLHQKRIVEWFPLSTSVPSASVESVPPVSKLCGGAIRLQLQLYFSKVERYKHAVDGLVTRYVQDFNHLPPFIDVKEYESKTEKAIAEQPEHEDTESPMMDNSLDQRRFNDVESHRLIDELATSVLQQHVPPASDATVSMMTVLLTPNDDSGAEEYNNAQVESIQPMLEQPISLDNDYLATIGIKNPSFTPLNSTLERRKQPLALSLMSSMGQHQRHTLSARSKRINNNAALQPHTYSRRQKVETPECFDEYSLYHPASKSTSVLEACYTDRAGMKNSRIFVRKAGVTPKTDLSIFKSPILTRRPSSSGFPERYIGLDNQACERLKRIFDRMDRNSVQNV